MDLKRLLPALACLECGSNGIQLEREELVCPGCGDTRPPTDGIYDLTPRSPLPLPKMYQDPDYAEWNRRLAHVQDYFYESHALITWVQNAGHRVIRRWCRSRPDAFTLDLACGHGAHRPYLHSPENVVALDIDLESLKRLRTTYPDYYAVRGDCHRLPFRDAVFDRVINIYNLEHLVHLDFALEEMARVLKPGGESLVSVPSEGGWAWRTGRRHTSARRFTNDSFDYLRANAIDHCNCIWQIDKAARRHFHVDRRHCFPLFLPMYHLNLVVTWRLTK